MTVTHTGATWPRAAAWLGAMAIFIAVVLAAACAEDPAGEKISDHPCWEMEPIPVRITPDLFEDLGVARTFWVPGPAPQCSFAFTLRQHVGFVDDAVCLMTLKPQLRLVQLTQTFEVSVPMHLQTSDCRDLSYMGTQRTSERPDGSYLIGDPPSWDAGTPAGQSPEVK